MKCVQSRLIIRLNIVQYLYRQSVYLCAAGSLYYAHVVVAFAHRCFSYNHSLPLSPSVSVSGLLRQQQHLHTALITSRREYRFMTIAAHATAALLLCSAYRSNNCMRARAMKIHRLFLRVLRMANNISTNKCR